jgi:hypothetical protein
MVKSTKEMFQMASIIYDNCLVGSGPSSVAYLAARELNGSLKDNILWLEAGDFFKNKNKFKKNNDTSSPKYNNIDFINSNQEFIKQYKISCHNINLVSCLRKGGNGAIWGAAISMFTEKEFGLPKKNYLELKNAYKNISSYFSFQINIDSKRKKSPILILSNIKKLMNKNKKKINFNINHPSLAINLKNNSKEKYDYNIGSILNDHNPGIFNTKFEVEKIKNSQNITFKNMHFLDSFTFENDVFNIKVKDLKNKNTISFKSKKLTLATGAIASPILVANFLNKSIRTRLQHNPTYFFSFLSFDKYFWKIKEIFVKLSNAEYQIKDKYFGNIFGQIYPCLIISNQILKEKFPFFKFFPSYFLSFLKKQVCLSTIYLDGLFSSTYMLINKNKVTIQSENNKTQSDYFKKINKIAKCYFKFVLPYTSVMVENGTDAHYGCTIPYSDKNIEFTTDEYGKIKNINQNLTIIDGSVLKNLPAKPLTFTIMANAYRIGKNEYEKT